MNPNIKTFLLVLAVVLLTLTACVRREEVDAPVKNMPDGEHIAAPAQNGLSVTIDGENGMVCYRERLNAEIELDCHPFQAH